MAHLIKYLATVLVGIGLLFVTYHAYQIAVADYLSYPVKRILGSPGIKPKYHFISDDQAFRLVNRALMSSTPNDPDLLSIHGRLIDSLATSNRYFWQSYQPEVSQEALAVFRQSVMQRPVSPWLWSYIVLMKAKLGEIDNEMQQAIFQAVHFGTWQPVVHIILAEVGLAKWGELSGKTQALMIDNIMRGLRYRKSNLLPILKKYDIKLSICKEARVQSLLKSLCQ